ncbi:MAG TPA: glycosyltransferase [bacterium]|nr:glycosyltransferase [bacterium]
MKPLDLLFCTHEPLLPLSGGCTIGNLRLVQAFSAAGHRVRVLSPLNLPLAQAQAAVRGVELRPFQPWAMGRGIGLRFPKYLAYAALYGRALEAEIRRSRPQALLVRNAVLAWPVARASRRHQIPALLSYTDLLSELQAADRRFPSPLIALLRRFETRVPLRYAGVSAISRPLGRALVEAGLPQAKLGISLDGADPACFRPNAVGKAERARRRQGLGLKPGQRLVVFHGTVEPHHGADLFPGLLRRAAVQAPGLRFLLIAGGPGAGALGRAVQGMGHVTLLPFQAPEEVGRWAACADVGLVPYPPSAGLDLVFTLKLLEYFAAGLPAASYRLAAAQAEFKSPAFAVAADEAGLVADLDRLSRRKGDPRLRAKVLKDFTWDAVAGRLMKQLQGIVRHPALGA